MVDIEEENIVDEIVKECDFNIYYETSVEYKNNTFKIAFEEEDIAVIKEIMIYRLFEDYGGIMETLYELDKAES